MPYEIRGTDVYNTETGQKKNKKPLSKGQAVRYMRALYAAEKTATKANYGARAGQTIAGRLGRGGDGQFTSVGSASAAQGKPTAKPGAKPMPAGKPSTQGAPSRGAAQIEAIKKQLEASDLSPEKKAALEKMLAALQGQSRSPTPTAKKPAEKPAKGGGGGGGKGKPEKPVTLSSPLTTALRRLGNGGKIDAEAMQQLADAGLVKGGAVTAQGRLYIRAYLAGDKAKMASILASAKPVAEKAKKGAAKKEGENDDAGGGGQSGASRRAMFAKMGGDGGSGGGGKLWPKNPETGKREPTAAQKKEQKQESEMDKKKKAVNDAFEQFDAVLAGARARMQQKMPALEGSEKQVKWAKDIRAARIRDTNDYLDRIQTQMENARSRFRSGDERTIETLHAQLLRDPNAKPGDELRGVAGLFDNQRAAWWIDTRGTYISDWMQGKKASLAVYKAANGTPRWISVTATNFIDRDGEIITHAALKADVDRSYARIARGEAADHGPLRWWHVPDTEIGRCDFRMVTEHALIESGTFTDPAYAHVVHKGDQVSLGFTYRPDLRDRHRAFWAIDSFERSICPAGTAINPYTSIGVTHD